MFFVLMRCRHSSLLALQVKALAEEVLAHLREVAGSDALLAAYNRARQTVNSARSERRRQRTLQVTSLLHGTVS